MSIETIASPDVIVPVLVLAGAGGLLFYHFKRRKEREGYDIDLPKAPVPRDDLKVGCYTCYSDQVAQTKDWTNLHWTGPWEGAEVQVRNIKDQNTFTVHDVEGDIFEEIRDGVWKIRDNAEALLGMTFHRFREHGVLHLVKVLVPCDEPQLNGLGNKIDLIPAALEVMKKVAAQFEELAGVRYGIVYFYEKPFDHMELFDIVGYNDYPRKSSTFDKGRQYEQMKKRLLPHQRTWIFPGGSYHQDPVPFERFAHLNQEVEFIIAFVYPPILHMEFENALDKEAAMEKAKLTSIQFNGMQPAYEASFRRIIEGKTIG